MENRNGKQEKLFLEEFVTAVIESLQPYTETDIQLVSAARIRAAVAVGGSLCVVIHLMNDGYFWNRLFIWAVSTFFLCIFFS